ncbi:MAG: ABC transporter permease [Pseudomonadota bacterium]|nr:ABC transporter permease [Pseudomonadota bacterium]
MSVRLLGIKKTFGDLTTMLAIFGLCLGVGCLVVAMSVFSGFETTLKNAIIDVAGHIVLIKKGSDIKTYEDLYSDIHKKFPEVKNYSPFVSLEAVAAYGGKISGVRIEGLDPLTYERVLKIKKRTIRGEFLLEDRNNVRPVMIGKGLARTLNVDVGEFIKLILPNPSKTHSKKFSPKLKKYKVVGILDLGKHEYNERIVVSSLKETQELSGTGNNVTGLRLQLKNANDAPNLANRILEYLGGYPYWTRTWYEINQNLLSALAIEKIVIFLVVLVMVIAAAFNVASTLYVKVINRYSDIALLKAIGAPRRFVIRVFAWQGLVLGFIGGTCGLFLGFLLAKGFQWLENKWMLLPPDVYKVEGLVPEFRMTDLSAIFLATFLVCFLATLLPALRGSNLNPTEGLRYE